MFETDFPHPTSIYPDVQARVAEVLKDTPHEVRKKLLQDNAVTLYNLPMSTREVLRRTFRRQRGHALIATLHPDLVPPHAPSRSVSVAVRGLLDECLLVVARRHTSWKGSLGSMSRFAGCAIWVLRFRIVPPCARPPLRRMSESHRVAVDTR